MARFNGRGEEADEVRQTRDHLERRRSDFAEHLNSVAARYDEAYAPKRGI
jgi:hypothetical protein